MMHRFGSMAVTGFVAAAALSCSANVAADPSSEQQPPEATASIVRRDLTTTDRLAGRVAFRDGPPVVAGRDGTLTAVPEAGSMVERGEAVVEIDGMPVVLLAGDAPAWRTLAVGIDHGHDVRQLNDNLAALGYADRDELPHDRFDWRTREAVRRWQADLEVETSGTVELGAVVFVPHDVRIATVEAALGTAVSRGQVMATTTRTEPIVLLDVPVADLDTLDEGLPVVVALPGGTRVDGTIQTIGRVAVEAEGQGDAKPTVTVEIVLEGAGDAPVFDAAPVVVDRERTLAVDVLAVPVGALVALTDGGYAVERVIAGGTELVGVEPGVFGDGVVEVTGGIVEGDEVVVPA